MWSYLISALYVEVTEDFNGYITSKNSRILILSAVTIFLMETVSGTRYESEVSN